METNTINNLADILENRITSRKNNRSGAAKLYRDTQCLYNDFRSVKILNNTFSFLIQKFRKGDGIAKLTATSKSIGDIAINILNPQGFDPSAANSLMVGDFVLDLLIDERYLILNREPYFRVEEVYDKGIKKKVNYNPYVLEMGQEFPKISLDPRDRIGISLRPFVIEKSILEIGAAT